MAQITTGIRRLLSLPTFYNFISDMLSSQQNRKIFVNDYVSPFANAKILDIGCGTGQIIRYLPESVRYVGFDLSEDYIAHAKRKYGLRGLWYCAPVSEMERSYSGTFDIVLALGILHHLDDSDALLLSKLAANALKPTGHLCTIDGSYVDGQNPIARYLVSKDRGLNVRCPSGYESLVRPYFENVEVTLRDNMLRVPYTHVIMVASKPIAESLS